MKYITLFLMIFSVHFQALSEYDCRDLALEHIDIGPNLTILNFVYKDGEENQHEYIIRDFDRAISLLTILNLHSNQNENPSTEPSFLSLLQFLADKLIQHYENIIEKLTGEGDPFANDILSGRIDIVNRLSEKLTPNDDILRTFNDDFFDHSSQRYFQHSYQTHYHTDYNQDAHRYESSEPLRLLINVTRINNAHDVIGYHIFNKCPIQGDLEGLLSQHVNL